MIRIRLIKEGRVVKQISSRLHESVILEQLKNYNEVVDEIVYEGELSEGAEEILRKVAKKVIPAAMAAGVALGGASSAKAQNYFPGTDRSIGQHIADIFSPNYQEIQRQRRAAQHTRQREFDAYHREIERERVQAARDAGRREAGRISGRDMPGNVKVYDQARISADGKSIILYDMNHQVTRLPRAGTDFVAGDSQRLSHYIRGSQVYYVRHASGMRNENVNKDPTVGTIPATGTIKPTTTTPTAIQQTTASNSTIKKNNDQNDDKDLIDAIKKAGIKLSQNIQETDHVDEVIRKVKDGYRLYSHSGKNLGTFDSRSAAEKHEREVNYFKHVGEALSQEEVEQLDELDRQAGSMINRYISKTTDDPKRKDGRNLALKKKWGDKNSGLPEPNVKAVTREAIEDPALLDILNKHSSSWEKFKQGGDITDNDAFYNELYKYFSDEMLSNEDPVLWITTRLDSLINEAADSNDSEMLADKNIIMQIRKAADYDKPAKLRLEDGTSFVVSSAVAIKLLGMFEKLKPESKRLMQQVLNKQDGIKKLISHLGEINETSAIHQQASKIAARVFDCAVKEAVMDAGLQKYIDAYPEEVSNNLEELKAKAEEEAGGSKNKWAIGKLPDGRYVSALIGTIKKWGLPIAAQATFESHNDSNSV